MALECFCIIQEKLYLCAFLFHIGKISKNCNTIGINLNSVSRINTFISYCACLIFVGWYGELLSAATCDTDGAASCEWFLSHVALFGNDSTDGVARPLIFCNDSYNNQTLNWGSERPTKYPTRFIPGSDCGSIITSHNGTIVGFRKLLKLSMIVSDIYSSEVRFTDNFGNSTFESCPSWVMVTCVLCQFL